MPIDVQALQSLQHFQPREFHFSEDPLQESIAELELRMEDKGWQKLAREGDLAFSPAARSWLYRMSRLFYLKNPLINRGVNVQSYYVWGQGIDVQGATEPLTRFANEALDANRSTFWSHQMRTLLEVELQVTGNLFLFFPQRNGSRTIRVRDAEEITEIVTNPDDTDQVWFYKREWTRNTFDVDTGQVRPEQHGAWFPDIGIFNDTIPLGRPGRIGGLPVNWDAPVLHVRSGAFRGGLYGVPETFQALDWARAYSKFLEDWSSITQALQRLVWKLSTKGSVSAAQQKLATTLGDGGGQGETNPPPVTGSYFISGPGVELDPIPKTGANVEPADGRYLKLMIAAAFGLPETFFGDADVGNHATAKTLDRPTELKFRDRQMLWSETLQTVLGFLAKEGGVASQPDSQIIAVENEPMFSAIFPPILEHDVTETMGAIVRGLTLDGKELAPFADEQMAKRLVMSALGAKRIDEAVLEEVKQEATKLIAEALGKAA